MRVGLSAKLVMLVVSAVFISGASALTVSYFSVGAGFERSFVDFLSTNKLAIQDKIDQYSENYKSLSVAQASRPNVIHGIETKNSGLLGKLSGDLVASGQADFMAFVDKNGGLLGSHGVEIDMQGRTTSSCISKSLNGGICTTFGPTKNDMVTLQATAPVSLEGKVIGAVLVGMSLTKNDAFADRMKKIFGTEVTIFSGNERVSSTIMDNGRRAVGTKLDNDLILDEVIKKKNIYSAVVSLFNKPHMAIYWPLRDVSENVIGMLFLGKDMSLIKEAENTVFNRILYVCLAAMALLSAVGFFVSKLFTTPVLRLAAFAQQVEKGDYSSASGVSSNDEIGDLAISVDRMVVALNDKICEADAALKRADQEANQARLAMDEANQAKAQAERAKAEGMLQAAQQLEGVVQVVSSASEELSAQIEQSSRGADEQSSRVRETATAMEEMNATVLEVARNAQQAADVSHQARQQAQEGSKIVTDAVRSIEAVHAQSIAIKEDMDVLGKQAEGIGQIMGVIADIADQTNLLALNAAIEAARAGDAGRGFAVVADEVRKLAEKTMIATQEVGQAITGIQEGTRKNIHNVEQSGVSIEEAAKLSAQSGESLKQILEFVHMVNDQVQSIATASEQQSAASEEINHSVEQVATISVETAQAMEQASSAVAELAQQSHALQKWVRKTGP